MSGANREQHRDLCCRSWVSPPPYAFRASADSNPPKLAERASRESVPGYRFAHPGYGLRAVINSASCFCCAETSGNSSCEVGATDFEAALGKTRRNVTCFENRTGEQRIA